MRERSAAIILMLLLILPGLLAKQDKSFWEKERENKCNIRCAVFQILEITDVGHKQTSAQEKIKFEIIKPDLVSVMRSAIEIMEQQPKLEYLGEFRLTAYCKCSKCCGKYAKNRPKDENGEEIVIGASGARLSVGDSIAVDPKVIPYGSIVYIDGHKYIAQDCGSAIKGNRIDIYMADHDMDVKNFGVRYADVYVEVE